MRAVGIGERLLPRDNFTLCEQFTLIGSGMIWNIYFGVVALLLRVFLCHRTGAWQGITKPPAAQTIAMVHLRISRITAVYPVFLWVFPVSQPQTTLAHSLIRLPTHGLAR